jgi:hypothetical protein
MNKSFDAEFSHSGRKNYSRNRSVYAKQNNCVFEAKVVCIFVAKLLCISIANWCVGKGGPLSLEVVSRPKARFFTKYKCE